jgi:hypothetical protein
MVKRLLVAGAAALALSNAAWAQMTTPGSINPGSAGPVGIGPDISAPVPGTAGTVNPADPRRAPSGSRTNDSSRMGTTGGVDAQSSVGGTTDAMTGSGALRGSGSLGSGSIGSGSGVGSGSSGTITSGAGAPLPGAGGMSGSGSMGGAAGTGGAGVGGAGAAGAGGAAGGAR